MEYFLMMMKLAYGNFAIPIETFSESILSFCGKMDTEQRRKTRCKLHNHEGFKEGFFFPFGQSFCLKIFIILLVKLWLVISLFHH